MFRMLLVLVHIFTLRLSMMPFLSWIHSTKIRTRVGFLIMHWMFSLALVVSHSFSDSVLIMQLLRDNLTVSIVYSIFFSKNCFSMLSIFVVVDSRCARCRWYQFVRKTSVDLSVYCFIVYAKHTLVTNQTDERHLFAFSLLPISSLSTYF